MSAHQRRVFESIVRDADAIAKTIAELPPLRHVVESEVPLKKRAGVLIAVFRGEDGEAWVWLTQRSHQLRSHAGLICIYRSLTRTVKAIL